jgi:hypothetical protein
VREQSGIQAGAGGYQLDVNGHTQLDGGAIASSAMHDRNFLSTGSLGYTTGTRDYRCCRGADGSMSPVVRSSVCYLRVNKNCQKIRRDMQTSLPRI